MKLYASRRLSFSDPLTAPLDGLVDVNDDVRVERLLEAYSFGIFPWPHPELPTLWYSPDPRGVLEFAEFHVPRSLRAFLAKSAWTWTFDCAFAAVVDQCATQPRPGQSGTWITPRLVAAYRKFHAAGYAHSLEVWNARGELIGGLYGVFVGGLFCGESMFYLEPNASKFAVVKLVEYLRASGLAWMDIQMVTPVLESFGGKYVPRAAFLARVAALKPEAKALDFRR